MGIDKLEERLKGVEGLPTLPLVLRQIQKVMRDERAGMAQIAAVVAKDQALAARAIRLVNSAWYGRSARIVSIQQVLVTLGLKTLNTLMLGLSVVKMFDVSKTLGFDVRSFWEHSFGTALLAKKLASQGNSGCDAEECFVAGLLHDMGRLVMEQFMHDDYITALHHMKGNGKTLLAAEVETFGFSHADTGAWLGRKWEIPRGFVLVMDRHHSTVFPNDALPAEKKMAQIVSIANELCIAGGIGASGEQLRGSGTFAPSSGLSTEVRNRLVEETRKEVASTIQEWSCG